MMRKRGQGLKVVAVVLAATIAAALVGACGDDAGDDVIPSPTPFPPEILSLLESVATEQGWDLAGPCELQSPDDPTFQPGRYCYLNAMIIDGELHVWVAGVASHASHLVILTETDSGEYALAGVTPVITPASGK